MSRILFYMFQGLNWLITLLPLRVLYITADVGYFFLYYFPSYRKKIVFENLRNSFPEKSEKELKATAKKFYHHFADQFVEVLKLTHMSNRQLARRMKILNPELIEGICESGRDILAVHSHYNNWEWIAAAFCLYIRYNTVGIYKPVQNKYFDKFMAGLRTRNGGKLAPMNLVIRHIIKNKKDNLRSVYGVIADQTPARTEIEYYTQFLNQDTPVFLGIEKMSARYGMAVTFLNVEKVKRGYYTAKIELLFTDTAGLPEYHVTETHVKRLEEIIRKKPEYWIWSHRRWKYKKPEGWSGQQ